MQRLEIRLNQPLAPPLRITEIGHGKVTAAPDNLRLALPPVSPDAYHDAQVSDYYIPSDFRWKAPLRMTVRAAGENLHAGTAGFGFWNHPFVPGERGFRLPQAAWFFFSAPPNNMALAKGVQGTGWKAATIDARRWSFLALAPTAPMGVLLMRIPALYARLWPVGQRALRVSEALLDAALLDDIHTYTLDWRRDGLMFAVDGQTVHEAPSAPGGPLGFVAWVDNQYAIVTPQGQLGFGVVAVEREQALLLESVTIEA
jgi:hypothetical protein